jgi:sulfate transport system ATP-binding protein
LYRNLSVFENVAFGLRALPRSQRPTEGEIRQRVAQLLELVRLPQVAQRYPSQLSGGQQQRIALARALAIEPRLLLLDEPFGALDAQVRKELRRWVRQLHDETRLTTLFVTHDQDEALELADRIVVMRDGRIEQVGTPDEIFERPASRFVHQFVGESSALAVSVEHGRVILDGNALDLIAPNLAEGPAWLLVRPQHLQLGADPRGSIVAKVTAIVRVGSRHRIEAEVAGGAGRIECELDMRPACTRGDTIHFKPTQCRVYPRGADTGSDVRPGQPSNGGRSQRLA